MGVLSWLRNPVKTKILRWVFFYLALYLAALGRGGGGSCGFVFDWIFSSFIFRLERVYHSLSLIRRLKIPPPSGLPANNLGAGNSGTIGTGAVKCMSPGVDFPGFRVFSCIDSYRAGRPHSLD